MYKKVIEYSLNVLFGLFFLYLIYSINSGFNSLIFFILLGLLLLGIIIVGIIKEKPNIDEINSETTEIQKNILNELSSSLEPLLTQHQFKLFHRDLSRFKVEARYKRKKDIIVLSFNFFPTDYPHYRSDVIISTKSRIFRRFVPLVYLKDLTKKSKQRLFYPLLNKNSNEIDLEQISETVREIENDFRNYAIDYLQGDYKNLIAEFLSNKKLYVKNYSYLIQ
jgi:hypothetical protein